MIFKFEDRKIFDSISISSSVSNTDGKLYNFSVLYKENSENNWKTAYNYTNKSFNSSINIKFTPILAKEICIAFEDNSTVIIDKIDFNIYNKLNEKIAKLFKDKEMFTELNDHVNMAMIERLSSKVGSTISEAYIKLKIAENILNNNGRMGYDIFTLKELENNVSYYFSKLGISTTGRIYPTPFYLYPNRDQILISNQDLRLELSLADHKPLSEQTFYIKKGINIVNLGDKTGHIFINGGSTGERNKETKLYTIDKVTGLHYKYGFTTEDEFLTRERNLTEMKDANVNSNTSYVEGRNFTSAIRFNWIKNSLPQGTLLDRIKSLDEFLDLLYYIAGSEAYFENSIPYKRLMWEGGSSNPHAGICYGGAYTAYSNRPVDILNGSLQNHASAWVVGHEVGHELDSNYHMGLFGEVMNNWFAEEARMIYSKSPRTRGKLAEISNTETSIYQMGLFERLAFWIKLRLFSNDIDFFAKYHHLIRHLPEEITSFDVPNRLMLMASMLTGRDTSDYFLRHQFRISEEAIEISSQYPKFTIDITHIDWDNQEEFRQNEKNRLFEIYKEKTK